MKDGEQNLGKFQEQEKYLRQATEVCGRALSLHKLSVFGAELGESTNEGSQLWKSQAEMEEEEKYRYVWGRRTSNSIGTMESIRSELLCQKEVLGQCSIRASLDSKLQLATF